MAQAQQLVIREGDVDPANFIDSLPPQLRLQVLSDMDDTTMSVLPPQVAAEARELRQELEDRHHRMMQDRMFFQGGVASLSSILRNPGAFLKCYCVVWTVSSSTVFANTGLSL